MCAAPEQISAHQQKRHSRQRRQPQTENLATSSIPKPSTEKQDSPKKPPRTAENCSDSRWFSLCKRILRPRGKIPLLLLEVIAVGAMQQRHLRVNQRGELVS